MPPFSAPLEALRRPAFTGDARCWPCTVLNGMLLWMAITVVVTVGWPRLAAVLGAVGIGAIWLRGYLIPYTPRVAPQLVSLLPGDPFDHDREAGSLADAVDVEGEKVAEVLADSGLRGRRLDPELRRVWRESTARYRELELDDLATHVTNRVPADARAERRWGTDYVILDGEGAQTLCPHPVAVADLAALDALAAAAPAVGDRERIAAAEPFRALLETCPLCEGDLAVTRSVCCGASPPGTATDTRQLICEACPARLHVYG